MTRLILGTIIGLLLLAAGAILLRFAFLIREIFVRLDELEHSLSGKSDKANDEESSLKQRNDEKLSAMSKELEGIAAHKIARYRRFPILMSVWAFMTPAHSRTPRGKVEYLDILRYAQRIVSNPWRQYHHGVAVDRWMRASDVRLGGHAFSAGGAFWYVVNEFERHGYKFENSVLDLLEQTLHTSELFVKDHIFDPYVRVVAQYELAIRACQNEEALAILQKHMAEDALGSLKHVLMHQGGPSHEA